MSKPVNRVSNTRQSKLARLSGTLVMTSLILMVVMIAVILIFDRKGENAVPFLFAAHATCLVFAVRSPRKHIIVALMYAFVVISLFYRGFA